MQMFELYLNTNFSVMAWIRPDAVDVAQTIFAKDRNTASNTIVLNLGIAADATLTVEIADNDDSFATSDSVNSSNPVELVAQDWQHIGYSV